MTNRDIIVIGGSMGCLEPIRTILRGLPGDLNAAIAIVIHVPATSSGIFATIASASTLLPVRRAADNAKIEKGVVYIAPPKWSSNRTASSARSSCLCRIG